MTATQTATTTAPQTTHRQILIAFSGLVLAMLLAALDSTIVSTALPTIVSELGGLDHLAWVVTAYLLAQTVVTPIYGKLGDLYGRKIVLQSAVVLFLIGSALCGLSRSLTQLIIFRAVQGLGGGGLVVSTQAIVGDLVPPRERGRYQGIFGAVYGLSSIAGPLLGGFFTTNFSWRWIFYINLPFGIAALVVLAATLPGRTQRKGHTIDYVGAALLAVALSGITLLSDLGGSAYAWSSPAMISLIVGSLILLALFVATELRAKEPVMPPRLFGNRAFSVAAAIAFVVGFALFGSVTYFPVYLQVVKGVSPTASGLQMIPMMGGMLVMSIFSGQMISRTGRYKKFPVIGTAIMTVGLFLLARLTADTTRLTASLLLLILGVGLGMVMQVLVIAVQNAVEYRDLGVATSGNTLVRLMGGSLGTAVLGAIFASHLAASVGKQATGLSVQTLAHMPPALRATYSAAFTASIDRVFLVAALVAAAGFLLTWLLPERPLRATVAETAAATGSEVGEAFARPSDESSVAAQLAAALSRLADRDVQVRHIQLMVDRAKESLTPLAAWLLVSLERSPDQSPLELGRARGIAADRVQAALDELRARQLIESADAHELTDAGCQVLERLVDARRAHLEELAADWDPARHPDAAVYLRDTAESLVPSVRRSRRASAA
jgi:EmrB/QacA subfamily drug resistance transporter